MAIALLSIGAIVCWLTFWTATHATKWQAKETEGQVAALSAVLAVVASIVVVESLVYGLGGYALLAALGYIGLRSWKAHKARLHNTTEQARLHS